MNIAVFLLIVSILSLFILSGFFLFEKNKKRIGRIKFKNLNSKILHRNRDMRAVPRVIIPDSLEVFLRFSEVDYKRLRIKIIDLSMSGLRANYNYKVKNFPETMSFKDAKIVTPAGKVTINSMNVVRIESMIKKGIIAFKFKDIDGEQFEILKNTISDIRTFSKDGH